MQRTELGELIERAGPDATTRVQIRRLPGLERSSTNYSLAMVAEHLAMTNRDMAMSIAALASDRDPDVRVDIARYKPRPEVQAREALADLDRSIEDLARALEPHDAIARATRTLIHPWFGPLSCATWACFPSFHQALHLKQARLVASALRKGLGRDA